MVAAFGPRMLEFSFPLGITSRLYTRTRTKARFAVVKLSPRAESCRQNSPASVARFDSIFLRSDRRAVPPNSRNPETRDISLLPLPSLDSVRAAFRRYYTRVGIIIIRTIPFIR